MKKDFKNVKRYRHICCLKNGKFQLVIFGKRENGKSPLLLCKVFSDIEEAVNFRNQWLEEKYPDRLLAVKKKDAINE